MEEQEPKQEQGRSWSVGKLFGMGMSKEERNQRYFGEVPRGTYPGYGGDPKRVHDLRLSSAQKSKLYGLPPKGEMAASSVESDTRQDLVKELTDKGLTRDEARQTIADLIKAGVLVEVYDSDLREKVLVLRR